MQQVLPKGKPREKGTKVLCEAMLMSVSKPQIQKTQGQPSGINAPQITSMYIIFKLKKKIKDKEKKILKESRGKNPHLTYRRTKIRIKSDFSSKTIYTRREWVKYLVLRGKKKNSPTWNSIPYNIILQK